MAESVVLFVGQRLCDLLVDEAKFLYDVSIQVEEIQVEFKRMQCFLKDADARKDKDETVRNWVSEIREVAYDVEDVLETFAIKGMLKKEKGVLVRYAGILKEGIALHHVGSEIQQIKAKISSLTSSLQSYGIKAISQGENSNSTSQKRRQLRLTYSHLVEEDFVGLDEDVELLVSQLVNEGNNKCYQVVSICGMGGLGKTTLARKVYHHGNTRTHFQAFAWACISQQWQLQDVLLGILNKLEPEKRDIFKSTRDEELVKELYEVQQRKKCLVVLDDIWSMDFWDDLGAAFPPGNTGSKILLTTRNQEIALHIDPTCFLHKPRCLNEEESWELLQRKVFYGKNSPDFKIDTSMEMLGRELVVQCGGLPLAITILGGLLVTKPTLREWKMVHKNFNLYLRRGQNLGEYGKVYEVLALSYRDLPYQLKPCFLYLGNFPEDSNIRTRNLYQMWAAEGFLPLDSQHRVEGESIMDVAEQYLCELGQRGMVQVQVEELSGKFKSCQLHDLMRDICLSNGKEKNFLKIIHFRNGHEPIGSRSSLKAATTAPTRRLSVFADVYVEKYFPPIHEKTSHVRSVLFFNRCTYRITIQDMLKLLCKDFKLLRVLQLDNFWFRLKLSKAIGDLVHLRYLSFQNSDFIEVPSSLSNLKFLQTLDLKVKSINSLTIPDVLWKLDHLRHLYLPLFYKNTHLQLSSLTRLETLKNFDTRVSDFRDLYQLTKLRKLSAILSLGWEDLQGIMNYLTSNSSLLRDSSFRIYYRFRSEKELHFLRQLVGRDHLRNLDLIGRVTKLPEYHYFSSSLMKLTLRKSGLEENPMAILEKIPTLKFFSLNLNVFLGKEMSCSRQGFPQLRTLELREIPDLEKWRVEEGAMSHLLFLKIGGCRKLEMIPDGLKFVTTMKHWRFQTCLKTLYTGFNP